MAGERLGAVDNGERRGVLSKGGPEQMMVTGRPLRDKEQRILDYVRNYWRHNSYSPTVREVQAYCDISSTSVVVYNLRSLSRRGLLRYGGDGEYRTIVPSGDRCPACGALKY